MSREVMQQALRLIEDEGHKADLLEAASILRAALAEQEDDLTAAWMAGAAEERKRAEQPQPVAYTGWRPISEPYEPTDELDIMLGDGSILCAVLPQFDGDLWWGGDGTGEKFIDPKYANVTHWRLHATAPVVPQPLTDEEILSVVGWERAEMYMKLLPNFPVEEARKETLKNARAVEAEVLKRVGVQR